MNIAVSRAESLKFSGVGPRPRVSSYDPDAQVFFDKGVALGESPLDTSIKAAVNNLVLDMKGDGIWGSMAALYPFVGGTATWHSLNLANPDAFQITWSGTITHNANGITGDGLTGWGGTGIAWDDLDYANSVHGSVYSRTSASDLGSAIGGNPQYGMFTHFPDGNTYFYIGKDAGSISAATPDGRGLFTLSRTAASSSAGYLNGSSIASGPAAVTPASGEYELLRLGASFGSYYASNLAYASFGAGLSSGSVSILNTAVDAFQSALGRANP